MPGNSEVHPIIARLGREISLSGKSLRVLEVETGINKSMLSRIGTNPDGSQRFGSIVQLARALGYELRLVKNGRPK